jgi:glycosyltransferase involved in cell wall biosynthesis
MQNKKISIVIPIYNEEPILEKEINNLSREVFHKLPSKYNNLELILVENGSTDNTLEIAKKLASQFPQIKIAVLDNPSYGKAVKYGVSTAQTKYVAICNIDFWDIDFLKEGLYLIIKNSADIVVASKALKGSHDKRSFIRRFITRSFGLFLKLCFHYQGTDTHGLKVFDREKLNPIINECITEQEIFDTEFIIRAQYKGLKIKELPITIVEKRKSPYGILKRIYPTIKDLFIVKKSLK